MANTPLRPSQVSWKLDQAEALSATDPEAMEADRVARHAGNPRPLPAANPGKAWYRRSDGRLVQLTFAQREKVIDNVRAQGGALAAQVDDDGMLLHAPPIPDAPPMKTPWWRLALDYMTGEDLQPVNPQFPQR